MEEKISIVHSLQPDHVVRLPTELGQIWHESGSNIPQWHPDGYWYVTLLWLSHHVTMMTALDQINEAEERGYDLTQPDRPTD